MDREIQLIISRIGNLILSEGDIPNRNIEEIVLKSCFFKTANLDIGIRIELICNPTGDTVKLNTIELTVLPFIGEQGEEVAYAHSRLQNVTVLKSKAV